MLMRCLEAGGLTPVYDKSADTMNDSAPLGYIPNPNGFYQFTNEITEHFAELYEGKLIKCPVRSLLTLPTHEYKLAFIKRDPKEIRASMQRWTPLNSWGKDEAITYLYDKYVDSVLDQLQQRGDFAITILRYASIVKHPQSELAKLAHWGISIPKMLPLIDESLYRLRLETDGK